MDSLLDHKAKPVNLRLEEALTQTLDVHLAFLLPFLKGEKEKRLVRSQAIPILIGESKHTNPQVQLA